MTAFRLPDLTLARGDTATLEAVLGRYLTKMLKTLLALPPGRMSARVRALHAATVRQLRATARREPGQALALMRLPTINVLVALAASAGSNRRDLGQLDRRIEELCLLVLLEQARRGRLRGPFRWRLTPAGPALRSIDANLELRVRRPLDLRLRNGTLELGGLSVPLNDAGWTPPRDAPIFLRRPYHLIVDGIFLGTSDNNPLSDFEAHPDKEGNRLDLGGHSPQHWCATLADAFALVDRHLPLLGRELRLVGRLILPVGSFSERHLSASYKEAVGTVYMSLHDNLMTMTEALIHELQHNKLNAACHLDPLLHNAFEPLFESPVRPDPRPLHGVLLAVHAFQPVAALYRAMERASDPLAGEGADPTTQQLSDRSGRSCPGIRRAAPIVGRASWGAGGDPEPAVPPQAKVEGSPERAVHPHLAARGPVGPARHLDRCLTGPGADLHCGGCTPQSLERPAFPKVAPIRLRVPLGECLGRASPRSARSCRAESQDLIGAAVRGPPRTGPTSSAGRNASSGTRDPGRRLEEPSWRRRFAEILEKNHAGVTTVLEHGEPTALGAGLLAEIRALDAEFEPLRRGGLGGRSTVSTDG